MEEDLKTNFIHKKIKEQVINKQLKMNENEQKSLQIIDEITKIKKQIKEDEVAMEYLIKSIADVNKQIDMYNTEISSAKDQKHNLFNKLKKLMKEEQLYLYNEKK